MVTVYLFGYALELKAIILALIFGASVVGCVKAFYEEKKRVEQNKLDAQHQADSGEHSLPTLMMGR